MTYKNLKIASIYFHMLSDLAKKNHQDIHNYLNDLIAEKYSKKR